MTTQRKIPIKTQQTDSHKKESKINQKLRNLPKKYQPKNYYQKLKLIDD